MRCAAALASDKSPSTSRPLVASAPAHQCRICLSRPALSASTSPETLPLPLPILLLVVVSCLLVPVAPPVLALLLPLVPLLVLPLLVLPVVVAVLLDVLLLEVLVTGMEGAEKEVTEGPGEMYRDRRPENLHQGTQKMSNEHEFLPKSNPFFLPALQHNSPCPLEDAGEKTSMRSLPESFVSLNIPVHTDAIGSPDPPSDTPEKTPKATLGQKSRVKPHSRLACGSVHVLAEAVQLLLPHGQPEGIHARHCLVLHLARHHMHNPCHLLGVPLPAHKRSKGAQSSIEQYIQNTTVLCSLGYKAAPCKGTRWMTPDACCVRAQLHCAAVLYSTIPHRIIPTCTVLYCTALFCTVLHSIVLTVLQCSLQSAVPVLSALRQELGRQLLYTTLSRTIPHHSVLLCTVKALYLY